MKIIEWLSDRIEEEINDAQTYAEKAIMVKQDIPKLAEALIKLSNEEMNHMTILHNEVIDIINDYRKKNGEPPKDMMAVYDYLHKRQIAKASAVRAVQSAYRS